MLSENDIMEELSLAYVRAVASRVGYAVEEVRRDRDSIDLHICARGQMAPATLHSPVLGVQLKSTKLDHQGSSDTSFPFDLKIKNYTDLIAPTMIPRVLVVFLMPEDPELWLASSEESLILRRAAYWCSLAGLPSTSNTASVRVQMPCRQVFDGDAVASLLVRVARQEDLRS